MNKAHSSSRSCVATSTEGKKRGVMCSVQAPRMEYSHSSRVDHSELIEQLVRLASSYAYVVVEAYAMRARSLDPSWISIYLSSKSIVDLHTLRSGE